MNRELAVTGAVNMGVLNMEAVSMGAVNMGVRLEDCILRVGMVIIIITIIMDIRNIGVGRGVGGLMVPVIATRWPVCGIKISGPAE